MQQNTLSMRTRAQLKCVLILLTLLVKYVPLITHSISNWKLSQVILHVSFCVCNECVCM